MSTDLNRIKKVRPRHATANSFSTLRPSLTHNHLPTQPPQELKDCNKDPETSGLFVQLVDEADLLHWKGQINGPKGTPYEGGQFAIDIKLPSDSPFVPPKMKFDTKIWHPNISSESGAICLDILKNEWSPALTIRTALISLQALMSAAEPDDPQDAVVAKQYKEKRSEYEAQAKYWTETYATGIQGEDAKVKALMEMGFDEETVKAALKKCNGNQEQALDHILSTM